MLLDGEMHRLKNDEDCFLDHLDAEEQEVIQSAE
jgi:hypothetical protein